MTAEQKYHRRVTVGRAWRALGGVLGTIATLATGVGPTAAQGIGAGTAAPAAPSAVAAWSGWVSSPTDGSRRLQLINPSTLTTGGNPAVTLLPATRYQTWQGVGASLTDASVELLRGNGVAQQLLFSPTANKGARLNLVRMPLSATDFSTTRWTWGWDEQAKSATAPPEALWSLDSYRSIRERQPNASVVAAAWTAPPALKTSGTTDGGGLKPGKEGTYGDLLVAQATWLKSKGVPLRALTLGNEPEFGGGDYPTMSMTDQQMIDIANAVSSRLRSIGVELWALDHNWHHRPIVDSLLAGAPGAFSGAAFHCYESDKGGPGLMAGLTVPPIVTECTGSTDTFAGTFGWDAKYLIEGSLNAGATGIMMWNLALDPAHGPRLGGCPNCRGLLEIDRATSSVTPQAEFYTLGHLARAADVGAVRIGLSNPIAKVAMVAFSNPDGTVGVFGHNDTGVPRLISLAIPGGVPVRFQVGIGEMFTFRGTPVASTAIPLGRIVVSPQGVRYYLDKTGYRHRILDDAVYACHGGAANTVIVPSWTPIAERLETEPAACFLGTANSIVKHPDGDSYVIESVAGELVRHWIPTVTDYVCAASEGRPVVTVARYHITELRSGADRPRANCILRGPGGDAHFINNEGRREWIPDSPTWDCEVGRNVRVIDTSAAFISSVAEVGWHYCLNMASMHGKVLRHADGDSSYIHPDNTRTWIPDSPTWDCRMRQGVQVVDTRWREYVTAFRDTGWDYCWDPVVFRNKVLHHDGGDSYFIHPDDTKTWIPDGATYACRTNQGKPVVDTRWREYVDRFPGAEWDYCYDINTMKGRIVSHPDGDSHYIDGNGVRHWIQNGGVYNCLRARGIPADTIRWRDYINRTPEGEWAVCGDTITTNQRLDRGQWLQSGNGRYKLHMQGDGNLVLYNGGGIAVWATGRSGKYTVVQSDGNLVEYPASGAAVWNTGTVGSGANRLVVQNDGNVVLYSPSGAVWWTNTVGR